MFSTIGKHISFFNCLLDLVNPELFVHEIALLLVFGREQAELSVRPPFLFKGPFIVGVIPKIHFLLLHFLKVVRY